MPESIWRPFTQMKTTGQPQVVHRAKDEFLFLADGRKIIDAVSSWWVITHGHCAQPLTEAIQSQSEKIDQVLFANFSHPPSEELSSSIKEFLPKSLSHLFFSDNGSTSVEVALKMSIQSWAQRGRPQKTKFLSFSHSYHGDTAGAMSVGGRSTFTAPYESMLFDGYQAKQGLRSSDSVEQFSSSAIQIIEDHHQELAGMIIEPIVQGAGGMIMWPIDAINQICSVAKKYDVTLIFDEVMTGFGRTGSLFAFEQLEYTPDILCLSKGLTGGTLPLALTIATDEIYESFLDDSKGKMFLHGHSYAGNPISCAAAVANLQMIKSSDLSRRWKGIENIHRSRMETLSSPSIVDRRICGTIAAIELDLCSSLGSCFGSTGYESKFSEKATEIALEKGVFLRPLGNIIYVLPPYCISEESLHLVWDAIDDILKTTEENRR